MSKNAKILWTLLVIGIVLIITNIESSTERKQRYELNKVKRDISRELNGLNRDLQKLRGY